MIKQTLFFSSPVALSLRYNQIVIHLDEGDTTVTRAIEDVGVVIIDNQQVRLTIPLLNALAENNVAVLFCDSKEMPCAMLQPLVANTTQQEVYRAQVEMPLPTKKRLWKEIVEHKIRNQAQALQRCGQQGDSLRPYYTNVLAADSSNREGAAAKIYWRQLFGKEFVRDREGTGPNALLNYGYAILRAATTRALLASGLLPAFGLFHRNRYNAFPLADDVMEPYRPFVDVIVYHLYINNKVTLDKQVKQELVRILTADVVIEQQVHPLEIALTTTTAALARTLKDRKQHLTYPTFL